MKRDLAYVSREVEHELRGWRATLVDRLLKIAAVSALPLMVVIVGQAVIHPEQWPAALTLVLVYLLVAALALLRRLGPRLRAWVMLLLGYAAGTQALVFGGLAGDGRVLLMAIPVLAVIIIGPRAGLAMTALTLLTLFGFAAPASLGWLADRLVITDNPLDLMSWLYEAGVVAMCLVALVYMQWRSGRFLKALVVEKTQFLEAARVSEARYQAVSELASDYAFALRLEPDGSRVRDWITGAVTRITGFTIDEIDRRGGWASLIHPDDRAGVIEAFRGCLEGQAHATEFRFVAKNGDVRWVYQVERPVWDETGSSVIGVYGAGQDITERKRAEEALRESQETAQALLNAPPDTAFLVDRDYTILALSATAAANLGVSPEEAIGTSLADLIPADLAEQRKARIAPIFASGKPVRFQDRRAGKWFDHSVYPIRDADGEVVRLAIFARDITARKKAEEAREDSERMFRTLAEESPNMIFINKDGRIVYANERCEQVMGYSREEFFAPEFSFLGLVAPEDRAKAWQAFERHKRGEEIEPYECALLTKVRRKIDTILGTKLIDYAGESAILGIITDITARKRAERQAALGQRLAAMGRMAAALAHEINNPLQAIQSNIELAQDPALGPQEREDCVGIVAREIERLAETTRRMLDFVRPADDIRRPVPVGKLVEETLALVGKPLRDARVRVTTDLPPDLPPALVVPTQIVQVFLNVILNAVEAMADGGQLEIRASAEGGAVVLAVANDGPPIAAEALAQIFDLFYTTKADGTGLGLPISRDIVQHHGGTIRAENLDGDCGTLFTISLPAADPAGGQETLA